MFKNKTKKTLSLVLIFGFLFSFMAYAAEIKVSQNSQDNYKLENLTKVELENEKRIYIDISGAEIYFDEKLEYIYISDGLVVDKMGSSLTISSPKKGLFNWFNNVNYRIVIGTRNQYRLIDIDAGGTDLSGVLHADELNIDAGGIDMSGEYYCRQIKIDGAGMNIKGYAESEYMKINGAGVDLYLDVVGLDDIKINGVGIDARLKYVDAWVGIRHISLNSVGGELKVMVPSNNDSEQDGHLDIDTDGFIDTDVDYY